jgi:N-acetylglucosaminyldiphosphoundecaprenol N-acetyl-beta-D-mannosaminyltransferase
MASSSHLSASQPITLSPPRIPVESLWVDAFPNVESFVARQVAEAQTPGLMRFYHLNIHGANMAYSHPAFRDAMAQADLIFCDGAGIAKGAKLLGHPSFPRFTYADWGPVALKAYQQAGLKVFWLGGEPWVGPAYMNYLDEHMPEHPVVGTFHGYLTNHPEETRKALEAIAASKPDVLFVGMGMPYQELWITEHAEALASLGIKLVMPLGAAMDYFVGKISRCPQWMGDNGLEWLYRLYAEPRRLFKRYVIGNPQFMARMLWQKLQGKGPS